MVRRLQEMIFVRIVLLSATSFLLFGGSQASSSAAANATGQVVFRRHPATAHINCSRVLSNDSNYLQEAIQGRVSYVDESKLPMDCRSIRRRNHFAQEPASEEEAGFPIAFARTVYKDYLLIEIELAASYAPQNWYCYALDAKADRVFKSRVRSLASCFTNVLVNDVEFEMNSSGHNMSFSFLECMKNLAEKDREWEYLITLQNHDISLRTNQELVQIFKWFDGANDVELDMLPGGRVDWKMDWSFHGLQIFKNDPNVCLNRILSLAWLSFGNALPAGPTFTKGAVQASLSRAAVDFLLNELDLSTFLRQLNSGLFGADELFLQTLMTSLDVPGGFTRVCADRGIKVCHVTRYSSWFGENCKSKQNRHNVCIYGLEDIAPTFRDSRFLFANKMMPYFDFGAVSCWYEELFRRTYFDRGLHRLDADFYKQLPEVRYHREKKIKGFVKESSFDCRTGSACA